MHLMPFNKVAGHCMASVGPRCLLVESFWDAVDLTCKRQGGREGLGDSLSDDFIAEGHVKGARCASLQ